MESSTNELLRKILSRLDRIEEKQDKQQRGQSDLSEEIQSVKTAVLSQGEKIHSCLQQLSGLTSTSADYQGQLEGNETSEQPMEQLRQLFQEERQSLQDKVQEAQNNTLDKIIEIHQEGKKMANLQGTLNDKVVALENKLDILGKQLEHKMKENTAVIKAHVSDVNKEMVTKLAGTTANLLQEHQEKLPKLKGDQETELKSAVGTLAADIVAKCEVTVKDCQRKIEENIQSSTREISTLLNQQTGKMTTFMTNRTQQIQVSLTKACGQIKQIKEVDLKSTTETLTAHILKCTETVKDCQKETNTKIETNGKTLTAQIYRSKMEQFSFVEKECQIIRDRQQPVADVPARRNYVFDMFVENFRSLIKSGEEFYSYPWHIDQFSSTVQGNVDLLSNGDMDVWLHYGRRPLEVGLQPRSDVNFKVTATVMDTSGAIEDFCLGEKTTGKWDENNIVGNAGWGNNIGTVSCQKLIDLGFGSKEKYQREAILIRFQVDIL